MNKQKGFLSLAVLLIILGAVIVAGGGIWAWQNYKPAQVNQTPVTQQPETQQPAPVACTPNWQCGWGSCTNGYQSQVAIDSNNCGQPASSAQIACPALARVCAPSNVGASENGFCGGIAGIKCASGLTCKLDGTYPDAGGKCIK